MASKKHFLHQPVKIFTLFILLIASAVGAKAQITVLGNVYDSSRVIPVRDVVVSSNSGTKVITDSTGHYEIVAGDNDSLTFTYKNKPTAKFAVKQIPNIAAFDISLHVHVDEKFKTMKEVRIYTKSYREDSAENRAYYSKIFNYEKPGVSSSINPGTGTVGMDLDEFINIFRFRRNKQLKKMQNRLLEQEEESFVKYRFNKTTVKRITQLEGDELDKFMLLYKPSFEFTQSASTVEFYQYILTASYQFKKDQLIKKNKAGQQ